MIIDIHTHITDNNTWFDTGLDASPQRLLRQMELGNIHRAVILPTPGVCSNRTVWEACSKYPEKFIGFATIDIHDQQRARDDLWRAKEKYGLRGVKLHPRMQAFAPDDERLYPLYELIAEYGWPVLFDGYLQSATVPMSSLLPETYDALAKRFPELIIVLAHMGGHRYWDAYFAAKSNPNLYLDTSYVIDVFRKLPHKLDDFRYIFNTLDRKLIFGTDFPELEPVDQVALMKDLLSGLPQEKQDNIMGANLSRLMDLEESP